MFEPDAYNVASKEVMGRQTAGYAFLKAVANSSDTDKEYLFGYTSHQKSFSFFQNMTQTINPEMEARWCKPGQLNLLAEAGTLYLPDPNLAPVATSRLRTRPDAFSITGVTHTTATHRVLDFFKNLITDPVMPWDALICTSNSVLNTVKTVQQSQREYLSWRLGTDVPATACQLPVIPLGIHTDEFEFSEQDAKDARLKMGIESDEIVFLFLGRLTTFMKAHVFPMYQGLQKVAEKTGKKITLIECGWYATSATKEAMTEAQAALLPDVKYINVDGRDVDAKNRCWAAANIFVSLSDNIQETFGLTPVEAMAAGLPLLISQWDGYSELCTDGVEGFQIPTTMPDDTGEYSSIYEADEGYSKYCVTTAQTISVDVASFIRKATTLVENPDFRKEMGRKGKKRARSVYDWSVVYRQYQALWQELASIRVSARTNSDLAPIFHGLPTVLPGRQSPSELFSSYPTHFLTNNSSIIVAPSADPDEFAKLVRLKIFTSSASQLPRSNITQRIFEKFQSQKILQISEIATLLGCSTFAAKKVVSTLLKMGLVALH